MKDFYNILEVNRNASQEEIKKAYRRLAVKHHPDKNNNDKESENKFKEISEAYEILSNPEKKARYDNPGVGNRDPFSTFWDGRNPFQSGDFSSFFGGANNGKRNQQPRRGRNINVMVALTLEEMMTGANKQINVSRMVQCLDCSGTGGERGEMVNCGNCGGSGFVNRSTNHPFGQMVIQEPCSSCKGTGKRVVTVCKSCSGAGTEKKDESIDTHIPKGSIAGVSFVLAGKGDWAKDVTNPGDLVITIEEFLHMDYRRDGINLIQDRYLSFKEICLGTDIEIPNLKGSNYRMVIPPGTQTGKIFRLRGKGLPEFNGFGTGDILVQVNVKVPEHLTEEQKKAIEYF